MISKILARITEADIADLVTNKIPEGKTLEYKEQLPGPTDNDKKECSADITALANTQGGDLVYGMTEERDIEGKATGTPREARGVPTTNPENDFLRLITLIRDTTDPRLVGIQTKAIPGFPDGPVLIVRVPNSWNKPHMVKTNGRFYARTASGKYPMDRSEIRDAIFQTEQLNDRIRRARDERIERIAGNDTPVKIPAEAKLILHFIPLASMQPGYEIDIKGLQEHTVDLRPAQPGMGWAHRYNLDGFLTHATPDSEGAHLWYLQIFRNGAIELVHTGYLRKREDKGTIPTTAIEKEVIDTVTGLWRFQQTLGIQPPLVVSLTLTGVKDYILGVSNTLLGSAARPIDRQVLALPEVLIEDNNPDVKTALRPVFDALWQAGGWNECKDY